jgi:hypothetical protein
MEHNKTKPKTPRKSKPSAEVLEPVKTEQTTEAVNLEEPPTPEVQEPSVTEVADYSVVETVPETSNEEVVEEVAAPETVQIQKIIVGGIIVGLLTLAIYSLF